MGPGLQLSQRMTQSLVLAPQLQQSLALLQAPTLELKALVEQELQQNPVLEEVMDQDLDLREKNPDSDEADAPEVTDFAEPPEDVKFDAATEKSEDPVDDFQAEFEKLVQMDQDWRDHFSQTNVVNRASAEDEERREFMFNSLTVEASLAQHLMEQVRDTSLSEEDRAVAKPPHDLFGEAPANALPAAVGPDDHHAQRRRLLTVAPTHGRSDEAGFIFGHDPLADLEHDRQVLEPVGPADGAR